MFTGIIQKCGILQDRCAPRGITRLVVEAGPEFTDSRTGDSVSVNGVCLSIVDNKKGRLSFDLAKETQDRTTLGRINTGRKVNLEKAISASERFNGHFVTGHIDGVGKIIKKEGAGGEVELRIKVKEDLARYLVNKGSVAIDGVSLTLGGVEKDTFSVYLIPLTLELTNFTDLKSGDEVNVETDLIGKYVEKFTTASSASKSKPLSRELLKEYGYI